MVVHVHTREDKDIPGVHAMSFDERGQYHLSDTKQTIRKVLEALFKDSLPEGVIGHEHGTEDNYCHY